MPKPTLKMVARLAGVAPATVSRVLNGSDNVAAETRKNILAVIADLNYTPNIHAANLRRKSLNSEPAGGSQRRFIRGNKRLRDGSQCRLGVQSPQDGAFIFNPEDRSALARQIVRLRKDLDRLKNYAERLQRCVDEIHAAYSRPFSSRAAHSSVGDCVPGIIGAFE